MLTSFTCVVVIPQSSGRGTALGSEVTYNCLAGAVSSPARITVTCEGDSGQWSPLQGSCSVVICGQPPAVDEMEVELTTRPLNTAHPGLTDQELRTAYGAQAVYTCMEGSCLKTYCRAYISCTTSFPLSLSLTFSLLLSLSPSLSLSLSHSHVLSTSLSHPLSLSLSFSLYFSPLSLSLSLSLSPSLCLSLYVFL